MTLPENIREWGYHGTRTDWEPAERIRQRIIEESEHQLAVEDVERIADEMGVEIHPESKWYRPRQSRKVARRS